MVAAFLARLAAAGSLLGCRLHEAIASRIDPTIDPQLVLTKAQAAADSAQTVVGLMEVFLAVLAIVGGLFAFFGFREGRLLRQARRNAERTEADLREFKRRLEASWVSFEVPEAKLPSLEMYLHHDDGETEEAVALEDIDRVTVVADLLRFPEDPATTLRRIMKLGRRWKKRARFAVAVHRFERAIEIANSLGTATETHRKMTADAHLYLALALIEWSGVTSDDDGDAENRTRTRGLERAERALRAAVGAGGESVATLEASGDLAVARGQLDSAILDYWTAFERGRTSNDPDEREAAWRSLFNAACVRCKKRSTGAGSIDELETAMQHLEALPKAQPWIRWAEGDPDLQALRDSPGYAARLGALGSGSG